MICLAAVSGQLHASLVPLAGEAMMEKATLLGQ